MIKFYNTIVAIIIKRMLEKYEIMKLHHTLFISVFEINNKIINHYKCHLEEPSSKVVRGFSIRKCLFSKI